jgi:purine-cytosine permease-like protein
LFVCVGGGGGSTREGTECNNQVGHRYYEEKAPNKERKGLILWSQLAFSVTRLFFFSLLYLLFLSFFSFDGE